MIISRSVLLIMRNVSDKSCIEIQKTDLTFNIFLRKTCRYRDNMEKYGRAVQATEENITLRMPISCCVPKATDAHSENVIHTTFPLKEWLHEAPQCYVICTLPVLFIIFVGLAYINIISTMDYKNYILISNFRRVLNAVLCFLCTIPASALLVPTFRIFLSVPSS